MLKAVLLMIAVCTDCFAAAIGMGAAGIKIPLRSELIISFTGALFLSLSVAFADGVKRFIPEEVCGAVSFILLTALGLFNLFRDFFGKIALRRKKSAKPGPAELFFEASAADADNSKSISPREAIALSAALSADSLVTGVSAGLGEVSLTLLSAGVFAAGLAALVFGQRLGRKIVSTLNISLGWLCGAILIVLAFIR